MRQYRELLKNILMHGKVQYNPRTEEHTLALSGAQSIYDLSEGFPLVTTKKVAPRLIFEELFWKLRGERSVKSLAERNVGIWHANAFQHHLKRHNLTSEFPKHSPKWDTGFERYKERLKTDPIFAETEGDLGPVYGFQWRHWTRPDGKEVDQLVNVLQGIKNQPGSRYHILSAWNAGEIRDMALGPCPMWDQFTVFGDSLDLHNFQRSCDVFLGVPFNIAQEAMLAHLVAQETGLTPGVFTHTYGNVHVYLGVSPRSNFWDNPKNVEKFKLKVTSIGDREDYMGLREWYLEQARSEREGNERKDHMPFVLEQLSKRIRSLPSIKIKKIPLLELIERPVGDVLEISEYRPCVWDSRAVMAA
jgi:thymidylate synthase